MTITWQIWEARNKLVFQIKSVDANSICDSVERYIIEVDIARQDSPIGMSSSQMRLLIGGLVSSSQMRSSIEWHTLYGILLEIKY